MIKPELYLHWLRVLGWKPTLAGMRKGARYLPLGTEGVPYASEATFALGMSETDIGIRLGLIDAAEACFQGSRQAAKSGSRRASTALLAQGNNILRRAKINPEAWERHRAQGGSHA